MAAIIRNTIIKIKVMYSISYPLSEDNHKLPANDYHCIIPYLFYVVNNIK